MTVDMIEAQVKLIEKFCKEIRKDKKAVDVYLTQIEGRCKNIKTVIKDSQEEQQKEKPKGVRLWQAY